MIEYLGLIFAASMSMGMVFFFLFWLEVVQGRLTQSSKWKDMSVDQWVFFLGALLMPIGIIGLVMVIIGK